MALCIGGIVVAYWWSNKIPNRPKGVSANSVFLWAPYVGLPAPRRGWWMACWEESGYNRCRLSGIDGDTKYEGEFVPYGHKGMVPADQLKIDPNKTREHKVWVEGELVPLVYLENGEILVPVSKYEEAARILNELSK
ncbi:MAG TPA: hypothetical protein VKH81_06315 [Candidatus Angelobacter sp.]|nr:hypothetical protein [Candidatus Angelobacter sp.]